MLGLKFYTEKARDIRNKVLDMCVHAGTGHVTSSFSCTEILVALYYNILNYDPENPSWEGRDRFVLSKGQASPVLYAVLADTGFFPKRWLMGFCEPGGCFGVHLQDDVPGVEVSTGSLGHGLGIAVGMALAGKMDSESYFTFVLLGDGELYEGSVWESVMFAGHHCLNNLIAVVDRNWMCATDFTENCLSLEPLEMKWKGFGWDVKHVDGHSFKEIFMVFRDIRCRKSKKPLVIIADTVKGRGVDYMENQILWHGVAPSGNDVIEARRQLKEELE